MEPPKITTFISEFCDGYYTIYLYTKESHIQAKSKLFLPFQNGGQITYIELSRFW